MKRFKLTNQSITTRCTPPAAGQTNGRGKPLNHIIYYDAELKGFGVVARRRSKSYIVQRDMRGRTVRVTIGKHGPWTPTQARRRARQLIVDMDSGINPNNEKKQRAARGITLREAVALNITRMENRGRRPRTITTFSEEVDRHLSGWLDRPLADITPADCARLHARLSGRGKFMANRVLTHVRAAYNTARRQHRDLPENPVCGVDMHSSHRRRQPVPWADLPDWYARVRGLPNPVRRDLQLLLLLTGLRRTDAATVRWEYVDLTAGTLHLPCPKGGEARAFTIPLSQRVVAILRGRQRDNVALMDAYGGDDGWVFPTVVKRTVVTHVQEVKEDRHGLPSPHRLRDTYAGAAHEAGVGPLDTKVLLNHRFATGDVTQGYIRQSQEHLHQCQEKITAFLGEKLEPVT